MGPLIRTFLLMAALTALPMFSGSFGVGRQAGADTAADRGRGQRRPERRRAAWAAGSLAHRCSHQVRLLRARRPGWSGRTLYRSAHSRHAAGRPLAGRGWTIATITGTATYLERILLPPGAVVEVTLADVARTDTRAHLIATTTFPAQGGPPYDFVLEYDPGQPDERGRYAVRVRILAGDRLLFTSTEHIPALDLDPSRPIVLSKVGGGRPRPAPANEPDQPPSAPPASLVNTRWKLLELDGAPASLGAGGSEVHMTLEQGSDVVRGFAGCNTFRGTYTFDGSTLQLGPLASTRKMCFEGMELEHALLAALAAVTGFAIDGDRLSLFDAQGVTRLRLDAAYLT